MKFVAVIGIFLAIPLLASADVFDTIPTTGYVITSPESSHMLFGELDGESGVVRFRLAESKNISFRLVVPGSAENRTFDAVLVSESQGSVVAVLDAGTLPWESAVHSTLSESLRYGPELTLSLSGGEYRLVITNPGNEGKYGVMLGGETRFAFSDLFHLVDIIPELKRDYFLSSPLTFLWSPFGSFYALTTMLVGVLLAYVCTMLLHVHAPGTLSTIREIAWVRKVLILVVCVCAVALLLYVALVQTWDFWLFAFSGALLYFFARVARVRAHRATH